MNSIGYSQSKPIAVTYNNETRYCITEGQALLVVQLFDISDVHKGTIIDLKGKVKALEDKSVAKDNIIEETQSIVEVEKERAEMSKQEIRRMNRKKIGKWFKNSYDKILFTLGGLSVGVGVGMGASYSK